MSIYEEHQLLTQLERYATQSTLPCDAQRLRRKLLVRQVRPPIHVGTALHCNLSSAALPLEFYTYIPWLVSR